MHICWTQLRFLMLCFDIDDVIHEEVTGFFENFHPPSLSHACAAYRAKLFDKSFECFQHFPEHHLQLEQALLHFPHPIISFHSVPSIRPSLYDYWMLKLGQHFPALRDKQLLKNTSEKRQFQHLSKTRRRQLTRYLFRDLSGC